MEDLSDMNIPIIEEMRRDVYHRVGRPAYLQIDLDAIENNVNVLRGLAKNPEIGFVGMVKGDGYGHGAIAVSHHLKSIGVERLAVATVEEGIQLRNAGIKGPLHVFGNTQGWELESCVKNEIIATITTEEAILAMGDILGRHKEINQSFQRFDDHPMGAVHIKIDSGMSRNGCSPCDLPHLIKLCQDNAVPLEGIFTHLADFQDDSFTQSQMETYYKAIEPYRNQGLLFHVANSGGIISGIGTELDLMRPGLALYGLPPGDDVAAFEAMGFQPVASCYAQSSLVKELEPGRKVGYGCTYTCEKNEWVATIPVGYADGYWRHLSNRGHIIRERTGEKCPVLGRVSMDAITVRLKGIPEPAVGESFILITNDFDTSTSARGIADMLGTIPYEVTTRFQGRIPKYYASICNKKQNFVESLTVHGALKC